MSRSNTRREKSPPPGSDHDGGLRRRSVLRAVSGGAVAFGAAPGVVQGAPTTDLRSGGGPRQTGADPDGVRWVPIWGGCDAARGGTECGDGITGIYDQTGRGSRIGLGAHTYQLRVQGLPWPTFEGLLSGAAGPIVVGLPVRRLPPPPSTDPGYGPYDLVVNGIQVDVDVVEDRAAPRRLVHADCEVPASCQEGWCAAVGRTVDALDESGRRLQRALRDLRRSVESRTFRVTVPRRAAEPSALRRLGAKIRTTLQTEVALLRAEVSSNRPTVDVSGACDDCPPCVEAPRVQTVRSWELRLAERSRATAALDDVETWAHHELDATVRLEPARAAGARELDERDDGPLGGLLSGVARLFAAVGGLFGGSPDEWMGQPVEATAWRSSGYVTESDSGTVSVVNTATGSYAVGEPTPTVDADERSDFAQLALHADGGEYELGFPQLPVAGMSVTYGLPNDTSSSFEGGVGYGAEIVRRARSGDRSTDESGSSTFRFPLGDTAACGSRLSGGVEVRLDSGGVVPSVNASVASVDGTEGATTNGRASVEWELVPLTYDSGERRVVDCL